MKGKHIVFYDGKCPLCNFFVRFLLRGDKRACFMYAPLEGEFAKVQLQDRPDLLYALDTMVLLEHYRHPKGQLLLKGKALLRICWYLGGMWALLGLLSFLPTFPFDLLYRIIVKNRYRLFKFGKVSLEESMKERFLP